MRVFLTLVLAGIVSMGLLFMPSMAMSQNANVEAAINPPSLYGNVPGQYVITLRNETFAEVDEQFPNKEQVTPSNIPEENAQVIPTLKREYDNATAEIVLENVAVFNGTEEQDYATSPLGQQGAVINDNDVFTHAIRGFVANGVDNPYVFLGNENVSTIEQSHYKQPATQYLPNAMNRGDSDKQDNSPGCKIDNREGPCDVDVAVIDAKVYPHPDLNLIESVNALDSGWVPGNSEHGMGNAGVCCARDNLGGVVGSAPGARIHSVVFFGVPPGASLDTVTSSTTIDIRALNWVAANAATIEVANWNVQCTVQGEVSCPINGAVNTAANSVVSAGVTLTTAAGNFNQDTDGFEQCGYTITICVGAYGDHDGLCGGKSAALYGGKGKDDQIAIFSNWGSQVDIAGPGYTSLSVRSPRAFSDFDGSQILGVVGGSAFYSYIGNSPHGVYQTYSGTSQANPTVSGIAAVIKANNPSFTPAQVLSSLLANAVPVTQACDGSSKGGYTNGNSMDSQHDAPLAYAGNYLILGPLLSFVMTGIAQR